MPEHYYIDGYNLLHVLLKNKKIKHANLEEHRNQLIHLLQEFTSLSGSRVTVVFDGNSSENTPPFFPRKPSSQGYQFEILFSSQGSDADSLIEHCIYREMDKENIYVVSSDRALREVCVGMGVFVMQPERFIKYHQQTQQDTKMSKHSLFNPLPVETPLREKLHDFLNTFSNKKE
ncbi:MAG: NYN domain-containing protein, partial [Candidatus Hydrogenedens sp.]